MIEISGTIITLDIFRCSVAVLVAPDNDTMLKGIPKLYEKWGCTNKDIEKDTQNIKEVLEDKDSGLFSGVTIPNGVDAIVLFMDNEISDVSQEKVVHEFNHAMRHICRIHGVSDEETESYMLEYLCNQFWTAQDDWRDNRSKRKKKK